MKKVISLVLSIVMVLSMTTVFADADINVTIDGKAQNYDVMPVIENGRTLVPMRAIFESLGAVVSWDDATKTVFGTKGDMIVVLQIGNKTAHVNGEAKELDAAPINRNSRTLLPVRFLAENLGADVTWNDATKTATLKTKDVTIDVTINAKAMKVNGADVALDSPAIIESGRTYLPVRAIANALGVSNDNIAWNGATSTATLVK